MLATYLLLLVGSASSALVSPSLHARRSTTATVRRAANVAMFVNVKTKKPGDGQTYPQPGQKCKMHYTGKLQDGTVFDTSKKLFGGFGGIGAFEFRLGAGEVIKGWDVGVAKMTLGEVAELEIGPSYGYGQRGVGPIPGNAVLYFEVELLGISG